MVGDGKWTCRHWAMPAVTKGADAVWFHLALFCHRLSAFGKRLTTLQFMKLGSAYKALYSTCALLGSNTAFQPGLADGLCRLLNFTFTIIKRPSTTGERSIQKSRESPGRGAGGSTLSDSLRSLGLPLRKKPPAFCMFQQDRWIMYGTIWFKHNTIFFCYSKRFSINSLKGVGQRKWSFGWRFQKKKKEGKKNSYTLPLGVQAWFLFSATRCRSAALSQVRREVFLAWSTGGAGGADWEPQFFIFFGKLQSFGFHSETKNGGQFQMCGSAKQNRSVSAKTPGAAGGLRISVCQTAGLVITAAHACGGHTGAKYAVAPHPTVGARRGWGCGVLARPHRQQPGVFN